MQERTYETRQGKITAKAITGRQAKNLKDGLPLGMVSIKLNDQANEHGVVIRCGEEDAWCLKQQSVEVDPKNEQTVLLANTLILAHSIKGYLDHGFGGCFIPALYRKKKPNGVEIGFAYFGTPCPTGIEASEFPPTPSYDQHFGDGFFTMFRHFYEELKKSSQKMNVTLAPVIGLDQRTSTHLEGIVLHCIIHGRTVYLCAPHLDEDDYLLTYLAATGVKEKVLALVTGKVDGFGQFHAQYIGVEIHCNIHVAAHECQMINATKFKSCHIYSPGSCEPINDTSTRDQLCATYRLPTGVSVGTMVHSDKQEFT